MPNITGLKQEEELEVIIALSKWKDKLKYIMIQEANNAAALLLSKQIMSDEDLILCVNSLVVRKNSPIRGEKLNKTDSVTFADTERRGCYDLRRLLSKNHLQEENRFGKLEHALRHGL